MITLDSVSLGFLLALLLGALIGVQRESKLQKLKQLDFAGFRAHTLISIMGYLLGYISINVLGDFVLLFVGFFGIFTMIIASYIVSSLRTKRKHSITSQMSAMLTFLIGLLVSLQFYYLSVALAIIITAVLIFGEELHEFAKDLRDAEIFATLKFALIAFVILPILPNKNFTPLDFPIIGDFLLNQNVFSVEILEKLDVFNFYYIWLMIVFISAIGYIGYILMKTIGPKKGIVTTGLLAGLMSSTALVTTFSIESKRLKNLNNVLIIGAVLASATMFIRIIFEILLINPDVLPDLIFVLLIMAFMSYIGVFFIMKSLKEEKPVKQDVASPFSLIPAIKFGAFFVFILLLSKVFVILFGSSGIFILSFLSGVADVDAITITLLSLASQGEITIHTAQIGILLAAFANTMFKGGIAYFLGSNKFSKGYNYVFALSLIVGAVSIFFIL